MSKLCNTSIWRHFAAWLQLCICIIVATNAHAGSFMDDVKQSVDQNERVVAAQSQLNAAMERIRVSKGSFFPILSLNGEAGRESIQNPSSPNSDLNFTGASAEIKQLIWDFGLSKTRIDKSTLLATRAELVLLQTRQSVMLEAIQSAIALKRATVVLDYSRRSEANIRRQTGLEQSKVDAGAGLSTDLLQIRTQLAGARSRKIQAEGNMEQAKTTFRRYFPTLVVSEKNVDVLRTVVKELPKNARKAVSIAGNQNVGVQIAKIDKLIAKNDLKETKRTENAPRLELVGKAKSGNNENGLPGVKTTSSVKIQLSKTFNLGFTSANSIKASQSDLEAVSFTLTDTLIQVKESVTNAFTRYKTARASASILREQSELAKGFLDLARKERKLGNRSLIDVLSGESAHFNALSDAAAAEADVLSAAFEILQSTGQLTPNRLKTAQVVLDGGNRAYGHNTNLGKAAKPIDPWLNLR
jgi:outer membrane protein TolC